MTTNYKDLYYKKSLGLIDQDYINTLYNTKVKNIDDRRKIDGATFNNFIDLTKREQDIKNKLHKQYLKELKEAKKRGEFRQLSNELDDIDKYKTTMFNDMVHKNMFEFSDFPITSPSTFTPRPPSPPPPPFARPKSTGPIVEEVDDETVDIYTRLLLENESNIINDDIEITEEEDKLHDQTDEQIKRIRASTLDEDTQNDKIEEIKETAKAQQLLLKKHKRDLEQQREESKLVDKFKKQLIEQRVKKKGETLAEATKYINELDINKILNDGRILKNRRESMARTNVIRVERAQERKRRIEEQKRIAEELAKEKIKPITTKKKTGTGINKSSNNLLTYEDKLFLSKIYIQ